MVEIVLEWNIGLVFKENLTHKKKWSDECMNSLALLNYFYSTSDLTFALCKVGQMYMQRLHDQFFTNANEDLVFSKEKKKKEMASGSQSLCLF